ncbi:MAG: RlmE family RNA methyltransferase [Woeseia sp.]
MSTGRRGGGTWTDRRKRDPYVLRAKRDGWRSRAVYKLEQILQKERILKPDMTCVDLGAAPGGWSQYVSRRLEGRCRIIALDILPIDALPSVEVISGDFTEDGTLRLLLDALGNSRADLVMSDMAPNISGNKAIDQPRSMYLAELALELAGKILVRRGSFICKLFQGEGTEAFVAGAGEAFERVRIMKPKASRPASSEVYLVARNYQL